MKNNLILICGLANNIGRAIIFTFLLFISITFDVEAQKEKTFLLIQSVDTKEVTKVKRGDFLQCIQRNAGGVEAFVFGEVVTIRQDGVMLRRNRFINGSGGFVYYKDITNIEKIRIAKRSLLPACVVGILLGEILVIDQIPKAIVSPAGGVASIFIMVHVVKRKRKSLYRNRVPDALELIPPGTGIQNNNYFEASSSRNQPE